MSGKRGRKCSIKTCDSYQHTHKHLSFFRFPKEPERCRTWIKQTKRFDLISKPNIHEERICQRHFEPSAFINESKNRLHQSAYPVLYLTNDCNSTNDDITFNGIPLNLFNDHRLFNMTKQELLYHAQMAAANNLTITAVSNVEPIALNESSFSEPLNLSKASASVSSTQTVDESLLLNKTKQSNDSNNESTAVIQSQPSMQSTQLNGNAKNVQHPPTNPANPTNPTNPTNGSHFNNSRRARQIFTQGQEEQLAVYVRDTSNYYSGLSSKEVRIMAYVWGVCNQVDMPPGWHESHQASFDWCVGFIKRTKLPPTMITGISSKGKAKSSVQSNVGNGATPLLDTSRIAIDNHTNSNATAIEID